jgi:hypothetical protein
MIAVSSSGFVSSLLAEKSARQKHRVGDEEKCNR